MLAPRVVKTPDEHANNETALLKDVSPGSEEGHISDGESTWQANEQTVASLGTASSNLVHVSLGSEADQLSDGESTCNQTVAAEMTMSLT